MPNGKTKFQDAWLSAMDDGGTTIGDWCTRGNSDYGAYCTLCKVPFSISNNGKHQILAHALSKKHRSIAHTLKCTRPLDFIGSSSSTKSSNYKALKLNLDDQVTKAEAMWCLKVVDSNFSFSSSKQICEVFKIMFSECPVAEKLQLGDRKVSYIISHGLAEYFLTELIKEINRSSEFYSLCFDETTTSQVKKQFDLHLRFWSSEKKVENAYLGSGFFGHADADRIKNFICNFTQDNKLHLSKVLMLSMDGPNVNKSVVKKINLELKHQGASELIDIGTCSLHKVHNSFQKGLSTLELNCGEFLTHLFSFFKLSPARREDIRNLQEQVMESEHFLLRHVSSRWLSLEPVVKRVIEQYDVLKEYFLSFLLKQKNCKSLLDQPRYKRIRSCLQDECTLPYLNFILSICPTFREFLTIFQAEGPLIHILHNKSCQLVYDILKCFVKPELIDCDNGVKLKQIDVTNMENLLSLKKIQIGMATQKSLSTISESKAKCLLLNFRQFFIKVGSYLQGNMPLTSQILKDLSQLHSIMRTTKNNENAVKRLCIAMKPMKLEDNVIDKIIFEWKDYKVEDVKKDWSIKSEAVVNGIMHVTYQRLDYYWSQIFKIIDKNSGRPKYANLAKLIKGCLVLYHANADVERGFSVNNAILRKDRFNLKEKSIVGLRIVKDQIRRSGGICNVDITSQLLKNVKTAKRLYLDDLEKKNREDELKTQQQKALELELETKNKKLKRKLILESQLKTPQEKEDVIRSEIQAGQELLNEGTKRLNEAIESKSMKDISIANSIITSGKNKLDENMRSLGIAEEEMKNLQHQLRIEFPTPAKKIKT